MLWWILITVIQHQHPVRPSAVCLTNSQADAFLVYMTSKKKKKTLAQYGSTLPFHSGNNKQYTSENGVDSVLSLQRMHTKIFLCDRVHKT